jgi:hypothetical protein
VSVAEDPKPKPAPDRARSFRTSLTKLGQRWAPDPPKPKPKAKPEPRAEPKAKVKAEPKKRAARARKA